MVESENDTAFSIVYKKVQNKNAYFLSTDKKFAFRIFYSQTSFALQAINDGGKFVVPASKEFGRWIVLVNLTTKDTFKLKANTKRIDAYRILKDGTSNVDTLFFNEVANFDARTTNESAWNTLQSKVSDGSYKAKFGQHLVFTTVNDNYFNVGGSVVEEFAYGRLITFRLFKGLA